MIELKTGRYQFMPACSPEEDARLEAAILRKPLDVPLYADLEHYLIDGHRRYKVYKKHNISAFEVKRLDTRGMTEADLRFLVETLNLNRRQLTRRADQWAAIDAYLRVDPAISSRQLAEHLGLDRRQVDRRRRKTGQPSTGSNDPVERRRGKDGKVRRLPIITTHTAREDNELRNGLEVLGGDLRGCTTVKQVTREAVREKRRKLAEEGAKIPLPRRFRLECCDFRSLKIRPGTLDIGFTDPPWDSAFVDNDLDDFARIAAEALKPGGLLVLYPSMYDLDRVLGTVSRHLTYCWCLDIHYGGDNSSYAASQFGMKNRHRLLLLFGKGGKYRHPEAAEWCYDSYYTGDFDPEKDKGRHEWQQDFEAAYYWLERFSRPGQTVADWFVGGGTFPAALKALGRRKFIGCDIKQDCINATKKVLAGIRPGQGSVIGRPDSNAHAVTEK